MSGILKVGGSELINDNGGSGDLQWGTGVPSGTIVQTQFTQVTTKSTQTYSADTDTPITVLQVNITPHFNNSIIKLECYFMLEYDGSNEMNGSVGFFYRNTTALGNTDSSAGGSSDPGNRKVGVGTGQIQYWNADANTTPENYNLTFYDRPNDGTNAIAQITYKFGISADAGGTMYINQAGTDSTDNSGYIERGCSYISATEIAQSGNGTITPAKAS